MNPTKRRKTDDPDILCPICFDVIKEAFVTTCGHSYCYNCINAHLEIKKDCPTCSQPINRNQIFPNFSLNKLLEKVMSEKKSIQQLQESIVNDPNLNIYEINSLLDTLIHKKGKIEADERQVEMEVLLDFLTKTKEQKHELMSKIQKQIECLDYDINAVQFHITSMSCDAPLLEHKDVPVDPKGTKMMIDANRLKYEDSIAEKSRRVETHLDDLQACYFDALQSNAASPLSASALAVATVPTEQDFTTRYKIREGLVTFTEKLSKFVRFSQFKLIATLKYGDIFNASSIVSSMEFDKDHEFFATAGVTKKIKIFDFQSIISDPVDVHYCIREMSCRSKISCLSWNTYIKSQLASSDYEGVVCVWDTSTGQTSLKLDEHEKRVWSLDFARADPTRLATGSDDTKVKIWATNQERSVATIESKANVCCVKFNPEVSNHLVFGSADHHIHYYDLRKIREPLMVFKSHKKAVSYVKFLSKNELSSASTDSTIKLWNVNQPDPVRTFTGHTNEKNFVGLTSNGEYIACGSENNHVYTFYKNLSKPILSYKFGTTNPLTGEESGDDVAQFVSSVCWKRNSNILLAANSQGTIKILELV